MHEFIAINQSVTFGFYIEFIAMVSIPLSLQNVENLSEAILDKSF